MNKVFGLLALTLLLANCANNFEPNNVHSNTDLQSETVPSDGRSTPIDDLPSSEYSYIEIISLGYIQPYLMSCAAQVEVYINSSQKKCVYVQDSCEASFAADAGYSMDVSGTCEESYTDYYGDYTEGDAKWIDVYDLGFEDGEMLCSQVVKVMYHPTKHQCLGAFDGCEIAFAEEAGFLEDADASCE